MADIFDDFAIKMVQQFNCTWPSAPDAKAAAELIARALRKARRREIDPVIDPDLDEKLVRLWLTEKSAWRDGIMESPPIDRLQVIQFDERGTSFMLVRSTPTFYEGVVVAQMAKVELETVTRLGRSFTRVVPEADRDLRNQTIDLSDAEISQIIVEWAQEKSALPLSFVRAIWSRDGTETRK